MGRKSDETPEEYLKKQHTKAYEKAKKDAFATVTGKETGTGCVVLIACFLGALLLISSISVPASAQESLRERLRKLKEKVERQLPKEQTGPRPGERKGGGPAPTSTTATNRTEASRIIPGLAADQEVVKALQSKMKAYCQSRTPESMPMTNCACMEERYPEMRLQLLSERITNLRTLVREAPCGNCAVEKKELDYLESRQGQIEFGTGLDEIVRKPESSRGTADHRASLAQQAHFQAAFSRSFRDCKDSTAVVKDAEQSCLRSGSPAYCTCFVAEFKRVWEAGSASTSDYEAANVAAMSKCSGTK